MSVKNAILNAFMWLTVLTFPLQCAIDPAAENIAAVCIVMVSSLTMLAYLKWGRPAEEQPLSTIAIFGFCLTTHWGALLVQTAYWTPLRLSLYNPLRTFGALALYQAIAMSMHMVYRYFSVPDPSRVGLARGLVSWAGVYKIPDSRVLWAMGIIGVGTFIPGGIRAWWARLPAASIFSPGRRSCFRYSSVRWDRATATSAPICWRWRRTRAWWC